jgi:hypothetical protein
MAYQKKIGYQNLIQANWQNSVDGFDLIVGVLAGND